MILSWYEKCVLVDKALRNAPDPQPDPPIAAIESPTDAKFEITDCKLYVPVVTLSAENDSKLLQQFRRAIKWNKYMSQMSNQNKNNNLNYLIDLTFSNVIRLFVLSFENENNRTSHYKYYVPSVEIKDYNVLIDGNAFFELLVKNIEETFEKNFQIKNHSGYYTRGNSLDYDYFKEHYKLIAIDLSKQIELENKDIKQQINFIGNLEGDNGAVIFFIIEKSEETIIEFLQNYASIV